MGWNRILQNIRESLSGNYDKESLVFTVQVNSYANPHDVAFQEHRQAHVAVQYRNKKSPGESASVAVTGIQGIFDLDGRYL